MRIKTHSLQFKFLVLVACAMGFAVAVSIGAIYKVYGSIQALDRVSREDFTSQQLILQAQAKFKEQVQEWKNVLLRGREPATLDKHWKQFQAREKETADLAREARTSTPNEEVRGRIEAFLSGHSAAGERYRKGLEAFRESKFDPYVGDKSVEGVDRSPTQSLAEAAQKAQDIGAAGVMKAVDSAEKSFRFSIVAIALAMLAALVVLWFYVRRAVLGPIGAAVKFAEGIAAGDLTASIHAKTRDEAGQLLTALGRMNTSLSLVVAQVRDSAENVVTASSQVQAGTADLSQRTEEQASSLEQTAASMEELASTVRQNADNAKQADSLARSASKRAEQGGAEIVHMVATMGEISDSAKRIADIISVIDGIAFQTNILALNAAVEAARAGEQGRGFAVVATEVRALAQRSAQAAREIKQLIGNSVSKVTDGTRLAEQAGDTIQALVIDVKQVSELMGSIAEASAEQSRGVQQVNKTVTEMDKVVQQNASAVQQSASAAEGMRKQAEVLARAVSTFRLQGDDAARVFAAAAAPLPGRKPGVREPALAARRDVPALGARKAPATVAAADDWEEF